MGFSRVDVWQWHARLDASLIQEYATAEDVRRMAETCPRFGELVAALDALAMAS